MRVPAAVLQASDAVVREFIGTYIACDGCVTHGKNHLVVINSASERFVRDLQVLCKRLGVQAMVRSDKSAYRNGEDRIACQVSWSVAIRTRESILLLEGVPAFHKQSTLDALVAYKQGVVETSAVIPPAWREQLSEASRRLVDVGAQGWASRALAAQVAHAEANEPLQKKIAGDIEWRRVVSVESLGEVQTHDIQTATYNCFFAEGVLSHNTYYETDAGGYRLATSIGGHATGEHMDRQVVDDPHDVEGAESEAQRQRTIEWWDLTMSTRGVTRNVRKVVIMQRLHEEDLSGHIIAHNRGEWERICLPMRFEKGRMKRTSIGGVDKRKHQGELLWPSMFDEKTVAGLEKPLGAYGTAGQMQQRPAPLGGGMFKRHFFVLCDTSPSQARRVRYVDKASTPDGGAFTCAVKMAESGGVFYIENVKREQLDPFERNRMIRMICEDDAVRHRHSVTTVIEQEPGSGGKESSMISVRELAGYNVQIDRVHLGKVERAFAFASQCGAGNVKIVGKRSDEWVCALLDEFEQFPNGKYKDQVDCCTGAFNRLALGAGIMSNVDLFGDDDDEPLTEEELEDAPDFFKELLAGTHESRRERQGYDPRELAE
jgi:predicted phage terminase large subunit-like protein